MDKDFELVSEDSVPALERRLAELDAVIKRGYAMIGAARVEQLDLIRAAQAARTAVGRIAKN